VSDAPPAFARLGGGLAMIGYIRATAGEWRKALESEGSYSCDFTTTQTFIEMKPAQLAPFEAIVFAGLINPSGETWDKAAGYVEAGGKLIVLPGAEELLRDGNDKPPPGYEKNKLLPGSLKQWIKTGREEPVKWAWEKAHPLLVDTRVDLREWVKDPRYGLDKNPPQVWGYWEVEPRDPLSTIVSYADDADAERRRPALLEKRVGQRGHVLLFTTPMDNRYSPSIQNVSPGYWNDYARTSWFYLVLTNLAVRYLTGGNEDAVLNYTSGEKVIVKWPLDAAARSKLYYLSGPDVGDKEAELIRGDNEPTVGLGPERLKSAGNYLVISDPADQKPELKQWRDGFSLNPKAEESNLERLPVEQIEAVFGPKSVTASDKERTIEDILGGKFSAPVELFPFLMILLLLFLAFENLLSNKFYRQVKSEKI
jgi:hypothetical protein